MNGNCPHNWRSYVFGSAYPLDDFLGIKCPKCEKFIPAENIAKYINKLEREWVKISETVPSEPGRYLVYHWYQDNIMILYWDGKKWENDLIVTHWKVLPKKPENPTKEYLNLGNGITKT